MTEKSTVEEDHRPEDIYMRPFNTSLAPYIFAAVALTSAAASCTKQSPNVSDKAIVVALSAPPSTLDPRFATDATGTRIAGLLYSSLVRIGPELKPVPELAESFTQDGNTYRFKIRPGVTFSNGRALDDRDIAASFDFARDPKSRYASSFSVIKSVTSTLSQPSREVVIELKTPVATFVSDLSSLKILPSQELASLPSGEAPIGSGPFVLEKKDANEIVLRARTDHAYVKPKSPFVVFKIVRDDNTRVLKMIKGELDLAQAEFPPAKVLQLEKESSLSVHKYPGLAMTYLLVNLKDPNLAKLPMRQAMAHAIDRDSIIKHKLEGLATPATSLITPVNPFFDSSLSAPAYSPARAKELLKSLVASGTALPELSLKTSSVPASVENGRLIARNLEDVGLKIKLQSFEWGTFYGDIQNGRFQLATMRWVGTVDPDLYRQSLHSKETPPVGRNRGSYANAEVDAWTTAAVAEPNFEKRKAIYNRIQKKVLEDLPIIPLWYDQEVAVVSKKLIGYEPPRDGSFWILTQVEKP